MAMERITLREDEVERLIMGETVILRGNTGELALRFEPCSNKADPETEELVKAVRKRLSEWQ